LQVTYATTMGQNLDMLTAPDGVDNFDAYNMARYCQIVKFKVWGNPGCRRRRGRTFGGDAEENTVCLPVCLPVDRFLAITDPGWMPADYSTNPFPSAWVGRRRSTPSTFQRRARCSFAA
jgi:hypothetical protein